MKFITRSHLLLIPTLLCGLAANHANAADSGWILRGDIGPSFVNDINTTTTGFLTAPQQAHLVFKTGVRMDLETGYQFSDAWALEGEFGYIYNPVDLTLSTGTPTSSLYQVPVLFNCIYTLPLSFPVKPYVGAGLGAVFSGLNDFSDVAGAGQLMAGVKWELNDRIDLGVGYKLLVTTSHDWGDFVDTSEGSQAITHAITASLTLKF